MIRDSLTFISSAPAFFPWAALARATPAGNLRLSNLFPGVTVFRANDFTGRNDLRVFPKAKTCLLRRSGIARLRLRLFRAKPERAERLPFSYLICTFLTWLSD
jgi:hypothetical protein